MTTRAGRSTTRPIEQAGADAAKRVCQTVAQVVTIVVEGA